MLQQSLDPAANELPQPKLDRGAGAAGPAGEVLQRVATGRGVQRHAQPLPDA
ncbi:MAG TPA: hypothetical protein PKM43_05910 [Verrucomicrobiota bacterium]|nr:hypothetical protein [Verrucomicrobiota bacterium]